MIKKTMKTLAMAFLVGTAAAVRAGDIVSIDVLEDVPYSLYNGGKTYPNDNNPHSIGESIFIRIRLINYDVGRGNITGTHDTRSNDKPYPWEYVSLSSYGSDPKLGLLVGGVTRYATYVSCLPTAETVRRSHLYYTDLIFEYKVLPGDLAQPVRLRSRSGGEVATATDKLDIILPGFYASFKNAVDTTDPGDLQVEADFSFCSDDLADYGFFSSSERYPPANSSADEAGAPRRDPTLQGQAVYVKTIDFDSDYVDTTTDPMVWRTIAQGSTKPTKLGNPSIVVDAAASFEGTGYATMWVWTEDDNILTPVGETQTYNVGGVDRKVLPIKISTGDEQKLFVLKATGAEGDGAWVYMSSAPTNMYGTAGELIKNTVRRWISVGAPEKPSISVTFKGNSWAQDTATGAYMEGDYPVEMAITLSEPASEEITVTLDPVLLNDGTNIDVYVNHVIATAPSAGLGNGWQLATNVVTFAAGDIEKFLYIYPLGATKGSARNGGTGIEFQISMAPATADAHFVTKTPGVFYVNPAAPNVLAPVSGQAYEFTAGVPKDITITIDDSCRNMRYLDGAEEVVVEGENLYTVVWERNDDTSTSRLEWKGLKPVLTSGEGTLTLTGVKYPNSGTYLTSQITVISPDGTKTVIPVSAEVSLPRTVTGTPDHENLTYAEGETVKLTVNLSKKDGESLFAFVEPLNADATNFLAGAQMIDANGKASGKGVEIPGTGTTTPKTINLTVLDGPCEPKFQVVLCSNEVFDVNGVIDRYTPQPVTLFCENVAPKGEKLVVGGGSIDVSGGQLEYSVPADNAVSLSVQIGDVVADRMLSTQPNETLIDWIGGADPEVFTNGLFITKWNFFNAKGKKVETRITVGTRNRQAVTNFTFTSIGTNRVEVQMLDKDMIKALLDGGVARDEIVKWSDGSTVVPYGDDTGFWSTGIVDDDWGPKFVAYIPVEDKANVSIVPVNISSNSDGEYGFFEGTTAGGFDIYLSVPAPVPLTVKLWVERMARTDGVTKDVATLGSFELKNKELGMDTNEYVEVSFKRGVDMQHVNITGMDGTPYSSYRLHAVVTTTTKNDDDIPMNEFYNESFYDFGVFNKDPKLNSIMANVGISYNQSTGLPSTNVVTLTQNQDVTIDWNVADFVRMDETNKFTVTWNSSEPGSMSKTNDVTRGTYKTKFSTAGEKTITLTINDKDGGANFYEWYFKVEASKRLYLYPHGPNGDALSDDVASTYMLADGLGVGTVEADGALGDILKFMQTWDFSVQANTAHVYARGLKAGEKDDKKIVITPRKGYPTQTGALTANANIAYVNTVYTNFDSYVYAFIENTANEGSVFSPVLSKIQPQVGTDAVEHSVVLPLAEKDAIAYPDRYLEVIFSREWLEADNCGDINADGVPDAFAVKVWRGGKLLTLVNGNNMMGGGTVTIGSDLVDLASTNPDEDFLPGIYNGAANTYAPHSKNPLTTRTELRGFDLGLNARDIATSEPSFSDDETFAWNQHVAENNQALTDAGKDDTDPNWLNADVLNLVTWSPEPSGKFERMDPTLGDTDGDGFPDGWEYYFWYMARVWVPSYTWRRAHPDDLDSNGNRLYDPNKTYPGQPRNGQFNVFERFNLNNIIKGDPIALEEVFARFNPCEPYNPERFNGDRLLRNDFDGDGLYDLEELAIGTNPCHWDTDGDRLCDSWEVMMCLDPLSGSKSTNPDGDFMAYRAVRLDMCWIDPADIAAAGLTHTLTAEGMPETVRVYGLPGLVFGVDYDRIFDDAEMRYKYVMLQNKEIVSYSFNPMWKGAEQLVYGLREDIPNVIPDNWIWGWYMVDKVRCETIQLQVGDEIFANLQFVLIHDQVRDGFGYDPRTAWNNVDGYVSARWDPSKNSTLSILDETGRSINTRPYETYDEYLVMKYRQDYGIDYSPNSNIDDGLGNNETIWAFVGRKTTNPNNIHATSDSENDDEETGEETDDAEGDGETAANDAADTPTVAERLAELLAEAGRPPVTTHGADTDQDGVPDGWELYTYRCPNAAPVPADEDGLGRPNALDFDGDALSYREEYAGVDSCDAYKDCASIYNNQTGKGQGWWNKFFPTNPGTMKLFNAALVKQIFAGLGNADGADTDLDGIVDGVEGSAWNVVFANGGSTWGVQLGFVYGSPEDDGLIVCFRGGGMNPCTIDTDLDGIPDGWEMQHAGVPVQLPGKTPVNPRGGDIGDATLDDATFIADGIFATGAAEGAEGEEGGIELPDAVYIAGGMDATWPGDAVFDDLGNQNALSWDGLLGTWRDVDFDHDGLQNYQEYLTQATRHYRYDDITTPLMGRQLEEGSYNLDQTVKRDDPHTQSFGDKEPGTGDDGTGTGYPVFDPADSETFAANAAEAWNGRSFVYYETVTTGVRKVIKVVDAYTGETVTNTYYYTAKRKRVGPGALLVEKHVANGGTALQYAWDEAGWRALGYFATPCREWDRAIASAKFGDRPVYMLPITDNQMVSADTSVAGYATTDPRMADTDGDGMDDFYETFHGLNPLLGTTPATAAQTEWGDTKYGDIISAQFYRAAGGNVGVLLYYNAWYNEWIYPTYSGLLGRNGRQPGDAVGAPIEAPQAYDPVLYPWTMGSPMVDADGDGIRNDEERIIANVADPVGRHTDPTPLWFTERTTPASYVAQYYILSGSLAVMPWVAMPSSPAETAALRHDTDATDSIYFGGVTYQYSFEENEGYDTDGDMVSDATEVISTTRVSSDPLRFDDPIRRQAFYLPGENSYAVSRDLNYRAFNSEDFLKQFTVECWVMPERQGAEQTVVERAVVYEGDSINTDAVAIRANFRIGLDAQGKVYGMFDNNDSIESGLDAPRSCQFVYGGPLPLNKWSHVALTFDGSTLVIYVNAILMDSATTTLVPANGVVQIAQYPGSEGGFPTSAYSGSACALLIGARPIKAYKQGTVPNGVYALYPYFIENGAHMESFDNLREYFKGYVDEVRVWDGARTGTQILENYKKSIGFADAAENREDVFKSWYQNNGTRNNNDGNPTLPPELVLNYDFSTLPGAVEEGDVAKTPAGFTKNVLNAAMSDYATNPEIDTTGLYPNLSDLKGLPNGGVEGDLLVGWWSECEVKSEVYTDYHVVPWIKNTVSHLPFMDGSAVDSFIYADDFGAVYTPVGELNLGRFTFPNTSVPYSSVVFNYDNYYRVAHSERIFSQRGQAFAAHRAMSEFQMRNNFVGTSDLVPMGWAFAKTCPEMWDGNVADPWEQTGDDTNGDGIPDWWEEYARHNYAPDLDPSVAIGWDTLIGYHGVMIPAGRAYVIDIFRGMQPDGTINPAYAVNADIDGNNIPDWWENLFGVAGQELDADADGDGLSNYAEYLISFGPAPYGFERGFPLLDPADQRTGVGQKVTDYFLPGPAANILSDDGTVVQILANQYIGEIATDHDFMEDQWEKLYSRGFANPGQHDPLLDRDADGWSNWAEARYANWSVQYASDLIDRFTDNDYHENLHPMPAIGIKATYYGDLDVGGAQLVVRTSNGNSTRMDAKFIVPAEAQGDTKYVGGMLADTVMHGFMSPGSVLPSSVVFEKAVMSSDRMYQWNWDWYAENGYTGYPAVTTGDFETYKYYKLRFPNIVLRGTELTWSSFATSIGDVLGQKANIVHNETQKVLGTIDLRTGEWSLDTAKLADVDENPELIPNSIMRVTYSSHVGHEWPKTVWLNDTQQFGAAANGDGFVREGLNTIEAFLDLDGNGEYTPGEPYAIKKGVDVGWHKTAEITMELRETSPVVPRINITDGSSDRAVVEGNASGVVWGGEGGLGGLGDLGGLGAQGGQGGQTRKIRIRRTSINGKETRSRMMMQHSYVVDDRAYISEGDLVSEAAGRFDLDWRYLVMDAAEMGIKPLTAGYAVEEIVNLTDGGTTNVSLGSFTKQFSVSRPTAEVVAPAQNEQVYTASPALSFRCDDSSATAFRIQIADVDGNVVYDSDVKLLSGRSAETVGKSVHRFTPPIYVDAPVATGGAPVFSDNATYRWRVAMFNAAFPLSTLAESEWSEWADFTMDVGNERINPQIPTGYGKVGVAVRYFGPFVDAAVLADNVIVEAHASADFSGQPLAQARLSSIDDLKSTADISTANAVLRGIAPGTVYLMAYIDQNDNGRRDDWESWGYVNNVGTLRGDIYTPAGVEIVNSLVECPCAVLYIEDHDLNRNELPDCLEPENFEHSGSDSDSDRDGLGYSEEIEIGTNPDAWDTDGDGMPDGWEYLFSNGNLDPLNPDADYAVSGDFMAYAEVGAYLVKIVDASDPTDPGTVYAILDTASEPKPQIGDQMAGRTLVSTYAYGAKSGVMLPLAQGDKVGVGLPVAIPAGDWRVVAVDVSAKVVLVHAQVYDRFGFDSRTCVDGDDAVNTKKMTALDKYLVVRYLEAIGVVDPAMVAGDTLEDWVNVNREWAKYTLMAGIADGDWSAAERRYGDGVADGWELYLGKDPWDFTDRASDDDGDGLPLYREYDGGDLPTDPWNVDTDNDGVFDVYAWMYHLKGDNAGKDADGDGLSNYAEYLISEVFQIVKLNPDDATTSDSTLDYYRKFGELYLGEVFTDHDRVDDDWEADYEFGNTDGSVYADRGIYDPDADLDGDGWSNYAEYRAGTSPAKQTDTGIDNYTLVEHPVPVVEMEVVYNGTADIEGRTLVVKAWNEKLDPDALSSPIATWNVTTLNEAGTATQQNAETEEEVREKYIGRMPTGRRTYYLGGGAVKEGSFKLLIKDKNYVEGEAVVINGQNYFQPTALGDPDEAVWVYDVIDHDGELVTRGGIFADAHTVGTIDYNSGRITIDFDDEEFTREILVGDPSDAESESGNNGNNNNTYHGLHPADSYVKFTWAPVISVPVRGIHYLGDTAAGFLREGQTTFIVEAQTSTASDGTGGNEGNGGNNEEGQDSTTFNNSHVMGIVRHVDVGWAGAKFKVELTDFNPITPRVDMRAGTFDRAEPLVTTDSRINVGSNVVAEATTAGSLVRVRVVRYAINGYPIATTWGSGLADVVYDKTGTWDRMFCELDSLLDDKFDVDWTDSFTDKVANLNGVTRGSEGEAGNIAQVVGVGPSITNIQYMVVIGDGDVTWERPDSTNTVNALPYLITRHFDYNRAAPVAVNVDGIQYSARPTFTWRMSGEEADVKRFGSSYTAFKLQVKKGNVLVYSSGILRAPATDKDGNFKWTAPICSGGLYEKGQLFGTSDTYTWQVTMYNAKFRSDSWSVQSVFSTAVNAQQELNDHGYSSIGVSVKYAGPSMVLGKYADITTKQGKVIVQAFSKPDFSGEPLSQGLATADVDDLANAEPNAWLKGLPAIGTYYIRAFIDMDGEGDLDDWEPWGYVKDEVTLVNDGTMAKAPLVSVWIEDSDSDRDWIPDAYEYAAKGWTTSWETLKGNTKNQPGGVVSVLPDGGIVLTIPIDELTSAGISKGLPVASLTAMKSAEFAAALLGLDLANKTTLEAIAEATRGKLVPKSVRVVAFSLAQDGSTVNLTVGADVVSGIAGTIVEQYYKFAGSDTVKVNVKVLKKNALNDVEWIEVYKTAEPISITATTCETIPVQIDQQHLDSGFFKLELEEVP